MMRRPRAVESDGLWKAATTPLPPSHRPWKTGPLPRFPQLPQLLRRRSVLPMSLDYSVTYLLGPCTRGLRPRRRTVTNEWP
jgi:hypothetical protein